MNRSIILSALLSLSALLTACGIGESLPVQPVEPSATLPPLPTQAQNVALPTVTPTSAPTPTPPNPLTIESMRQREYPGSDITIEQTLAPGANYKRYIVSYLSDGLKIYALMTVPNSAKPQTGFPVILFNHGYIPPATYKTTERYVNYVDAIARAGYIVLRSDYRGHGNSEGEARGGYGSPDYTIDVLNAMASIKRYKDADPNRVGMWGHSMGGQIIVRAMVIRPDIKAGVIWSGVVASYPDLISQWRRRPTNIPTPSASRRWRENFFEQYGTPAENPEFWNSISPNAYLADLSGPIQLHHSEADAEVPWIFSQSLHTQVLAAGKVAEFFRYQNDDHNLSKNFSVAMQRSIAFFDKYVKRGG